VVKPFSPPPPEQAPVSPVPEPETYAMMAAGLALLGWRARLKALRESRLPAGTANRRN
jgi:hypothetical protein